MEELYLKTLDLLATVPAIRYADLDKGQIDNYETRPALAYPAALIRIDLPQTKDMGNKTQQCSAKITIRLVFNFVGETAGNTPTAIRNQSLSYFNTVNAVYKAMQGFYGNGFTRFSRQNLTEEKRTDGLKVVSLTFATTYIDTTAL